jgi:DNA invertase Pin-like site-specific DNA recombinase
MADVVELARAVCEADDALQAAKEALRIVLLNGAAGDDRRPPPPPRSKRPGPPINQVRAATAAEAEAQIVALLKDRPGLKTSEIVKATGAKGSTVSERLRRLKEKGEVEGGGQDGWVTATAQAT